jgi:hypothetical protein
MSPLVRPEETSRPIPPKFAQQCRANLPPPLVKETLKTLALLREATFFNTSWRRGWKAAPRLRKTALITPNMIHRI